MKINELTKYDLVAIDFMSGDDQVTGLDLATKENIEVLQTGTGSRPTIFNVERDSLHGAIYVSHLRHSGVNFEDVSGEGHVPPIMQGKSQIMKDVAAEQGLDIIDVPLSTLDEDHLSTSINIGNNVLINKFDAMSNMRSPTEVKIVDYLKATGQRDKVVYKGKDGKVRKLEVRAFRSLMKDAQNVRR